jgi:hypothetical protein
MGRNPRLQGGGGLADDGAEFGVGEQASLGDSKGFDGGEDGGALIRSNRET